MTDKPRRYGQWDGNPAGFAEDPNRCIAEVCKGRLRYQCEKPRGHGQDGLYCKVHDPVAKKKRQDASYAKYQARSEAMTRPHRMASAMKSALEAIASGHNDPRSLAAETLREWFNDQ